MGFWNFGVFFGALMGAGVEFLEVVAIAYAVARSGFPREALRGTVAAVVLVGLLALLLGPRLALFPIRWVQCLAGSALLYFGGKWIPKSVLRLARGKRAGWIEHPLKGKKLESLGNSRRFNHLNFIIMMKGAAVEVFEAVLIVMSIALGSKAWLEAISGAFCAAGVAVTIVLLLHGYLVRLPDVLLKLGAGILFASFGTFWLIKGVGLGRHLSDFSLPAVAAIYACLSFGAICWMRWRDARGGPAENAEKREQPQITRINTD
ncbi:MAG: hypothetical protein JO015_04965 [Verrucomicrobia bacterium]|nr:hypothetical protein [Verrucomicrobiota bacterium]